MLLAQASLPLSATGNRQEFCRLLARYNGWVIDVSDAEQGMGRT
jgi:hypothetical protein